MIEHLKGREKQLKAHGWTGQAAEWIALVCLHSGLFIRSQYTAWRGTGPMPAVRLVHKLLSAKVAAEEPVPAISQSARLVRIFGRKLYEALGIKDVRHRKPAGIDVLLKRLLSLDYVLDHTELPWLPTEAEKVRFCEQLEIPADLLPRKQYAGAVGETRRYFAIKMPIAAQPERVTFVYIDPEEVTDKGFRSWGSAHFPLWEKLRERHIRIRVVAVSRKLHLLNRCERILKQWAEGPLQAEKNEEKQEIERINRAIDQQDEETLADYGGLGAAIRLAMELKQYSAGDTSSTLRRIDEYQCTWSNRVAAIENNSA